MDVLYLLGNGSKWNNNEIRFSLRSICKNAKNLDRVFVVGYKPDFLSDKIIHVPCEDLTSCPAKNVLVKIGKVINETDISEDFLLSSDDHFYVKKVDFNNYPYSIKGELPNYVDEKTHMGNAEYQRMLIDTKHMLSQFGISTKDFTHHANNHYNKTIFRELQPLWDMAMQSERGISVTSAMGNAIVDKFHIDVIDRMDCKVRKFSSFEELNNRIGEREVFSIFDDAIACGLGEYLYELFPEPCIYESDDVINWNYNGVSIGSKHDALIKRYQRRYPLCDVWIEGNILCLRKKGSKGAPTKYILK